MPTISKIMPGIFDVILVIIVSLLIITLVENKIKKDLISYKYLYEHNITYKQVPTKEYAEYILDRKYQENIKELEG
jgi:hypothetical protein